MHWNLARLIKMYDNFDYSRDSKLYLRKHTTRLWMSRDLYYHITVLKIIYDLLKIWFVITALNAERTIVFIENIVIFLVLWHGQRKCPESIWCSQKNVPVGKSQKYLQICSECLQQNNDTSRTSGEHKSCVIFLRMMLCGESVLFV